jgi:hypothetical protein
MLPARQIDSFESPRMARSPKHATAEAAFVPKTGDSPGHAR